MPEYLLSSIGSLRTVPLTDSFAYVTLNLIWKKKNPNISIPVFVDSFSTYIQTEILIWLLRINQGEGWSNCLVQLLLF